MFFSMKEFVFVSRYSMQNVSVTDKSLNNKSAFHKNRFVFSFEFFIIKRKQ